MHNELNSFLTDVWENRDWILYDKPDPTGKTVEDRVYSLYAPMHGVRTDQITPNAYDAQVNTITSPAGRTPWIVKRRDAFFVWDNSASAAGNADYRVYVNAKHEHAVEVFKKIMHWGSDPIGQGPAPAAPRPPNGAPIPPASLTSGYAARVARGHFADVIAAAKIAFAKEAFTGRADLIVVYLNPLGGRAAALALAHRLAKLGAYYRNDHPPMTQKVHFGIAVGPEVSGTQWQVGTSYGEVRCNLIAQAMVHSVTGRQRPNQHPVPVGWAPVGSPNRLDFVRRVAQLFQQYGINPQAPWR